MLGIYLVSVQTYLGNEGDILVREETPVEGKLPRSGYANLRNKGYTRCRADIGAISQDRTDIPG